MEKARIRDENTKKLVLSRDRPELPRWYEVDEYGTNETYFKVNSGDVLAYEKPFWRELKILNEDRDRLNQTRKDKKDVMEAVCSRLRLNRRIKDEVVRIGMCLDARRVNYAGGLRALAIGTIAYVVNNKRGEYEGFGYDDRIQNEDEFQELADKLDVDVHEAVKQTQRMIGELNLSWIYRMMYFGN